MSKEGQAKIQLAKEVVEYLVHPFSATSLSITGVQYGSSGVSVKTYIDGQDRTLTSGVHINPLTSARTVKIGANDGVATFAPIDARVYLIYSKYLQPLEQLRYHQILSSLG